MGVEFGAIDRDWKSALRNARPGAGHFDWETRILRRWYLSDSSFCCRCLDGMSNRKRWPRVKGLWSTPDIRCVIWEVCHRHARPLQHEKARSDFHGRTKVAKRRAFALKSRKTDGRKRAKRSISLFSIHWWIPCDSAYSSRRLHNGWLFREGITQRTKRREFENKETSWAGMLCERHIVLLLSLFFYFHTYYNVPTFDYSFCQDFFLSASGDAQRNRYVGRVGSYYSRHLLTKLGILLICSLIFSMQ